MKEIQLTQNQVAIIDDEDFERVSKYKWCAQKIVTKNKVFYYAKRAYSENGKHTTIHLHRFILNPFKGFDVDHINHDTLDCRRSNLRIATRAQNRMNSIKQHRNGTGYKGVHFVAIRTKRKYLASITKDNNTYRLGSFFTAKEAAIAYDQKAKELFGEFAYLNFPEPTKRNYLVEKKQVGVISLMPLKCRADI